MESLCVRCFVEIEVTAEYFIGTFAAQYHLDAHALDDAGKQVHRGGGAHGGHVVGLDVVDDIAHGVQTFLNGVVDFVVYGTDMVGHFLALAKSGAPFSPTAKLWSCGHHAMALPSVSMRRAANFRATAEMTELSNPPESSTP